MLDSQFDIAIVGAGMAGLSCAQSLHQAGYKVVVVDKSRGLGGRMATRRLHGTHADHGVCYLKPKSAQFQALLNWLVDRKVIRVWTDTIHELNSQGQIQPAERQAPCYAAANGIAAISKFLSLGLTLRLNHRVERIEARDGWRLCCESGEIISASAIVVAIPAPQAAIICGSLDHAFVERLKAVEYFPCISAIAVYPLERQAEVEKLGYKAIVCPSDPDLGWIGINSTKQFNPVQPAIVVQSNARFAAQHLEESDLEQVGERLLHRAAEVAEDWFTRPEVLQVHRWRYAFPVAPVADRYLTANTSNPLVCTGDWCGGNRVESAFEAGLATANYVNQQLDRRVLPEQFWLRL
ncbi:FAD-dependent oxidoreductase [Cyanobacteria bacterium FACHB-DQ100]|uniref:NAD(P)/FAD-dependent oxidoreductase n=1 Tax=Leptolyngbya sp. DQ-M1 TaxID=2933920 RepID=UPI001988D85D|nr:FAD-dependent oxidoreductase [Cyanobacteria bacterium FACHB-DQ100]